MFQLGNYGCALSHSFDTGVTLAFLHGWNVLADLNHVTKAEMLPHAERIQKLVKLTSSLWTHPLLIPVILLEEHIYRANAFRAKGLSSQTTRIESQLGVTNSGVLSGGKASFDPVVVRRLMGNDEARIQLTSLLNTTITNATLFIASMKWDPRYCQFLRNVCDQIQEFRPQTPPGLGRELKETIDTLECAVISCSESAESIRQRLELQLSVVIS
jgi:hypothetical protein